MTPYFSLSSDNAWLDRETSKLLSIAAGMHAGKEAGRRNASIPNMHAEGTKQANLRGRDLHACTRKDMPVSICSHDNNEIDAFFTELTPCSHAPVHPKPPQ